MTELQEYMTTGMLGSYQPGRAILQRVGNSVSTIFRDTTHQEKDGCMSCEREMLVGGKCFHITSVFSGHPTVTPTEKMLELINIELNKDAHGR